MRDRVVPVPGNEGCLEDSQAERIIEVEGGKRFSLQVDLRPSLFCQATLLRDARQGLRVPARSYV